MTTHRTLRAIDPRTAKALEPAHPLHDAAAVDAAAEAAWAVYRTGALRDRTRREALLRAAAHRLEERGDALVDVAGRETGLPEARLRGELARTTGQLRMFANLVADEAWREPRVDRGDPNRTPAPKPDVRSHRTELGPVVVFGASNFPLAFGTPGGDTASALAAGCPVIVKAHPGHPGTAALVGACLAGAVAEAGLPAGAFAQLFDDGFEVGLALVRHPRVRAVAFTGSRAGGLALARAAAERAVPVPVYAEMGSVNPVVVLPGAAERRAAELAAGLHASFTLGVGQFCTNPGLTFVPEGPAGDAFREALAERVAATPAGVMLNRRVCDAFGAGVEALEAAGARAVARGRGDDDDGAGFRATAVAYEVDLAAVRARPSLLDEVFGPAAVLVRYRSVAELEDLVWALEGQLTATVQAEPEEAERHPGLLRALEDRVGRLLFGGWPTGVEVGPAMVHGGPFPASSDGRSTSVGTHAIERFTRLVAFQDAPEAVLPAHLRDAAG
jgi:NADP-dependent aldehyde dehydrogenase